MPFKGTSAMDQKTRFIADYLTGFFSHTELCHSYGISRPTGYKWIDRYEAEGSAGLVDRSRCPHHCPQETPREIVAAIVELRKQKGWGPKKLLKILSARFPAAQLPAGSTCNAILARHGLILKRRRRSQIGHPGNQAESMKWHGKDVLVSLPCVGQYVGLEEIYDGVWHVYLGPVRLGTFYEETLRIVDSNAELGAEKV